MPVTRHFSPTGGIFEQKSDSVVDRSLPPVCDDFGIFCDWLSIYQRHPTFHGARLPLLNDGAFVRYDADGVHECTTLKKLKIEGSHETGIFVRCDGETVQFEGNVSKFCRQDNVFGFTFYQCIQRINALLCTLGLPPFTPGKRFSVTTPTGSVYHWTGARITRIDVTENFSAGSKEDANHFMRFLSMQQASRLKTGTYGEGETVDFGRGSRRVYSKVYLKGPELLRHARKRLKGGNFDSTREYNPYLENLSSWCDSVGLVRFETTYKSTFLIDNYLQFLGAFDMTTLIQDFTNRKSVFTRSSCDVDDLSLLPKPFLSTLRMWQAGDDVVSKMSRTQFYRHRSALLPYGVDIAIKNNVIAFVPKTRVIKLGPVSPPDFITATKATKFKILQTSHVKA